MYKLHVLDGELDNLIDALELARDQRMIKQALRHFCESNGFDRFAHLNVRSTETCVLTTYPAEWQRLYFDKKYALIDPVVISAKRNMEIFSWSQDDASKYSKDVKRFFREADDFGIRSGLSIPIRTPFGGTAILTLASEQRRVDFAGIQDTVRAMNAVAFAHAHLNRVAAAPCRRTKYELTPREVTCLTWASLGKTMSEIADLLQIDVRTVRNYLDLAREKLGGSNIAHAVRLAVMQHLI
ncbi:putative transcriptional activator protein TraR (plasmid) [Afipia carboxidovorans OM5]|uniref:Putative transcriptional activator protein TraR n=1 Tax=Afipia carboxidovorans (strain ATCC 49405 / DSM 1227 / KCTC 32145 / OM5) TaxID=504832 RepID=Q6LB43_AFIC5|nr:autoinducer binding domain-containing protein [Afipia carboxidovorans]AEI04558.1 putative transcriptional activator protein TraR [Afipia carboxidovorans OM4]AEI08187.1 putative transcriptional activator protein TraR [Afipia carboxidovorans OM5]